MRIQPTFIQRQKALEVKPTIAHVLGKTACKIIETAASPKLLLLCDSTDSWASHEHRAGSLAMVEEVYAHRYVSCATLARSVLIRTRIDLHKQGRQ